MPQIIDFIAVEYNEEVGAYPVNFTCQLSACKLLKNAIRSQHSFDDTSVLSKLVNKLRHEIEIIAK
jgi:hypothetical protein